MLVHGATFPWAPAAAYRLRASAAVRVPFGPMADSEDAQTGVLPYDPAAIGAPMLIVRGEWDAAATAADAERLFERLGTPLRRAVVVGRGTDRMHLGVGLGRWRACHTAPHGCSSHRRAAPGGL